LDNPKRKVRLDDLAIELGVSNSGTFSNYCTSLATQGIICRGGGEVWLNPEVLE
jgi:hypothetical protein